MEVQTLILLVLVVGTLVLTASLYLRGKRVAVDEKIRDFDDERRLIEAARELNLAKEAEGLRTQDAYALKLAAQTHTASIGQERDKIELRIYEKGEVDGLDIEKERKEIETAVTAAIRLELAPEHKILEIHRLLMEQMDEQKVTDADRRKTSRKMLNYLKGQFNDLCKRPVQGD